MIDCSFEGNFIQQSAPQRLYHSTAKIIAMVVSMVFSFIPGVGWLAGAGVSLLWSAIDTTIVKSYELKMERRAKTARRGLAALGGPNAAADIAANGQMMNTRQSSDPIRIIYGLVKTGGTWVYSKPSSVDNTILNTVISWGEGELEGIGTGIDNIPIYSGATVNDLSILGEFIYV